MAPSWVLASPSQPCPATTLPPTSRAEKCVPAVYSPSICPLRKTEGSVPSLP